MVIGSNQRLHSFSDNQINIEIDAKLITKVKEAKSQGVIIDEHLSWSNHIGDLSKKISSAIGALKRIRPYIPERTALQIYQALILLHFEYCTIIETSHRPSSVNSPFRRIDMASGQDFLTGP